MKRGNKMDLSVVHITDTHFSSDTFLDDNQINSIAGIINNNECSNMLLLFSGDISNQGKTVQFDQMRFFASLLEDECKEKNLFFVCTPGNHDCFYGDNPTYTLKESMKVNNDNFNEKINEKLFLFNNFDSFAKEISFPKPTIHNQLLTEAKLNIENKNLSIFSLNNVLFCTCNDQDLNSRYNNQDSGNVFIPKEFFDPINECKSDFCFIVMHLPITYFDDKTLKAFYDAVENKDCYIFFGHVHHLEHSNIDNKFNSLNLFCGPAYLGNDPHEPDFSILNFNNQKFVTYKYNGEIFVEKHSIKRNLKEKKCNKHKVILNDDFMESICNTKVMGDKFKLDDIFVFPLLSHKLFNASIENEKIDIDCFEKFHSDLEKNRIAYIFGDEDFGKTTFCNFLFLKYYRLDFCPVIINGDDVKPKSKIKSIINTSLLSQYESRDILDKFYQINIDERIIFIDNSKFIETSVLTELLKNAGTIILLGEDGDFTFTDTREKVGKVNIGKYFINPMFISKRKELIGKVFDLKNRDDNSNEGFSKEEFINQVEGVISHYKNLFDIDPLLVLFSALEVYGNAQSYNSRFYSSVVEAKLEITLENIIKENKWAYDLKIIKRIVSRLAYDIYEKGEIYFSSDRIRAYILHEENEYGHSGVSINNLINICIYSRIFKINDNNYYLFYSREIFAYFIAYECLRKCNDIDSDKTLINSVFNKDIYVPLNFLIIMSIATSINSTSIPSTIVDFIYRNCSNQPVISDKEILSFSVFNEKICKLEELTEKDILEIDHRESECEKSNRENYLQNKDNYYYYDQVSCEINDIEQWQKMLKIATILLNRFSSSLRLDKKKILVECVIKLPNILISKFHDYIFNALDRLYVQIVNDEKSQSGFLSNEVIQKLKSVIFDIKRAFILYSYAEGARGFTNQSVIKLLQEYLKEHMDANQIVQVQEMMLLSFSRQKNIFIPKMVSCLSEKSKESSFVQTSAFIIARNYVIRNYEDVQKNHRDLFELIVKNKSSLPILLANKNR